MPGTSQGPQKSLRWEVGACAPPPPSPQLDPLARPPAYWYALEFLELTHQLRLLLGSHAGEDRALDQDLRAREEGTAEAAATWGWGSCEEGAEHGEASDDQGCWGGSPTLGSSLGKCFMRTPKVDPLRARWLDRGSGSTA